LGRFIVTAVVPALVVGGGISGLVCAYSLRKAGIDAVVLEATEQAGGIIRSIRRDGYLLEMGPQSFNSTTPILELCKELGIETELIEAASRAPRFLFVDGKLQQAPLSPPAFFTSSLFRAGTKWSVLRDVLGKSVPPSEDESIATFVRRKFSAELLEKLVGPFVSGIYAGDPEKLSARAAFPQLHEAEASAGSIIRGMVRAAKSKKGPRQKPTLRTFRGGNETLMRALAANLGANVSFGTTVTAIHPGGHGNTNKDRLFTVEARTQGGDESFITERLIVATPTNIAANLLKNVDPAFTAALSEIEYAPVAVVSLGYRRPDVGHSLHGFGFLVPRSARLNVLGTVWNSSLFPARAPEGDVLLTSFLGGATNPAIVKLASEELVATTHRELAPILSISAPPAFYNVQIYERAIPQYNLGHTARVAALDRALKLYPNLRLAGNYLHGPAIGACVEQAQRVAQELTAS
jgi:oxygen-dependent protoporphyrinogen oxidase